MTTTTDLRERIARTIHEWERGDGTWTECLETADAVLALISGPEPELVERIETAFRNLRLELWHCADQASPGIWDDPRWRKHGKPAKAYDAVQPILNELAALKQSLTTQGGELVGLAELYQRETTFYSEGFNAALDKVSELIEAGALAHGSSDGWRAIDPERWFNAKRDTEYHRSQVQGFLYDTPKGAKTDKPKHHVIRDCTKKPGKQVIWSAFGDDDDYARLDAEMDRQIELYCTKLIADRYAQPPKHSGGETDV